MIATSGSGANPLIGNAAEGEGVAGGEKPQEMSKEGAAALESDKQELNLIAKLTREREEKQKLELKQLQNSPMGEGGWRATEDTDITG